ncbi:hypothetical protein J2T09_003688 [Neorhizobium huautlense]|uniref:DUF2793 domain-containing protein n=1 Tax=Neorhizobium huautlense TaxID=67774 RepID=A0ABT9PWS4_9HYPH|nr:DUF2793 domain-containing protein [Neorhizobium huautlense]MDP9838916.1 hypothetical protein [Neorhizobium huautlense]
MADRTTNLSMPFTLPSQAQKHVTHNEALQALDAIVQLTVEGEATAPPANPTEGSRFVVDPHATGDWVGHDGHIAARQDGAWTFLLPKEGWLAWFRGAQTLKIFYGSAWNDLQPADADPAMLGINTSADSHNRLAVASEASLFTHVGHGHQVKVNKAATTDTASLLFQSNWTGYAEMGLAGDNDFSIKVGNGTNWVTALKIRQNGTVSQPQRPMGRAYRDIGVAAQAAGSDSGFTILDQVQGSVSLSTTIVNAERALRVPADGIYLLSLLSTATSSSGHAVSLMRNRAQSLFTLWSPAVAPLTVGHTQISVLAAGDELSLRHSGTAQLYNAAGLCQLTLAML